MVPPETVGGAPHWFWLVGPFDTTLAPDGVCGLVDDCLATGDVNPVPSLETVDILVIVGTTTPGVLWEAARLVFVVRKLLEVATVVDLVPVALCDVTVADVAPIPEEWMLTGDVRDDNTDVETNLFVPELGIDDCAVEGCMKDVTVPLAVEAVEDEAAPVNDRKTVPLVIDPSGVMTVESEVTSFRTLDDDGLSVVTSL